MHETKIIRCLPAFLTKLMSQNKKMKSAFMKSTGERVITSLFYLTFVHPLFSIGTLDLRKGNSGAGACRKREKVWKMSWKMFVSHRIQTQQS